MCDIHSYSVTCIVYLTKISKWTLVPFHHGAETQVTHDSANPNTGVKWSTVKKCMKHFDTILLFYTDEYRQPVLLDFIKTD